MPAEKVADYIETHNYSSAVPLAREVLSLLAYKRTKTDLRSCAPDARGGAREHLCEGASFAANARA